MSRRLMDRIFPSSHTAFTVDVSLERFHSLRCGYALLARTLVAALWVFPPETWPLPTLPVCDPRHHAPLASLAMIGPRPRSFDRKDGIVSFVALRPLIVCSDSQRQRDLHTVSVVHFRGAPLISHSAQRIIPARSVNVEVGCEETLQHTVHAGSRTPAEIPYLQGGMSEMYRMWRGSASWAWYRYCVLSGWYRAYRIRVLRTSTWR